MPAISAADFEAFQQLFYARTGIRFDHRKRYFVDRRLLERMRTVGAADCRSYLERLRAPDAPEWQPLINSLTINETYFWRESYQLEALGESLLPEITRHKAPGQVITIWTIPAATGEEPYSIALYLTEYWEGLRHWDVGLLASDIDTDALARAQTAVYGARSVQFLPPALLRRYFVRTSEGFHLVDDLRRSVTFTYGNLVDPESLRGFRDVDVIFCRNLLIYFDDASRRRAAEMLYAALRPGGFLCLGHSESMSRISTRFRVRRFPKAIVYQKPEESA